MKDWSKDEALLRRAEECVLAFYRGPLMCQEHRGNRMRPERRLECTLCMTEAFAKAMAGEHADNATEEQMKEMEKKMRKEPKEPVRNV